MVTELDWVRRTIEMLGWIVPGELKVFSHDEIEDAKGVHITLIIERSRRAAPVYS